MMRSRPSSLRVVRRCPFSGERTGEPESLGSFMEVREVRLLFMIIISYRGAVSGSRQQDDLAVHHLVLNAIKSTRISVCMKSYRWGMSIKLPSLEYNFLQ